MIRTSVLLLFVFSFIACQTQRDPCLLPTDVNVRVKSLKRATDSTYADSVLVNLNLAALDNDTIKYLYLGSKLVNNFFIRLSPKIDSCVYLLQPDSSLSVIDTLRFFYGRRLQFLSNACGYTYFFTLDSIHFTKNTIDTILIVNHDVTTDANTKPYEHVQIVF
jgi:hypothetical protein